MTENHPIITTANKMRSQPDIELPCFIGAFFWAREGLEEETVPFFLVVATVLFFWTAEIGLLRDDICFDE